MSFMCIFAALISFFEKKLLISYEFEYNTSNYSNLTKQIKAK